MIYNLTKTIESLSLGQRLKLINLYAMSVIVLVSSRYGYMYWAGKLDSPVIFIGLAMMAVAVVLLLCRFTRIINELSLGQLVDNKDYYTMSYLALGYAGILIIKYALGDHFDYEAVILCFVLAVFSGQLNRFSLFISVSVIAVCSFIYAYGLSLLASVYIFFYALIVQLVIWSFNLGTIFEIRAKIRAETINAKLLSTQHLLEHTSKHNERIRLSREIHDLMGHNLAALNLNLQACVEASDEPAKAMLKQCQQAAGQLYEQLQATVDELQSDSGFNIQANIQQLIEHTPYIDIRLNCPTDFHIKEDYAQCILRIIQTFIANSLSHGGSKYMDIDIALQTPSLNTHTLVLHIADHKKQTLSAQQFTDSHGFNEIPHWIERFNGTANLQVEHLNIPSITVELPYES